MKPVFKITTMCWLVDDLGYFKTKEEALAAIEDNKLKHSLVVRISDKTKRQLQQLVDLNKVTVSELIRTLIDKEVNGNGR